MEGAAGADAPIQSVIIRTPDQKVKDMEVECQPQWSVGNLKSHLCQLYPGNPTTDMQRLILAGKLLQDKTQLSEIFKTYNYRPIVHFVCTQTLPEPASDAESNTAASSRSASASPTNAPVDPSPAPVRQPPQLAGNPRWSAHMNQLQMWHQQLEANQAAYYHGHQHHFAHAVLRRPVQEPPVEQAPPPQPAPPPPPQQPEEEQHDLLDVFYLIIRGLFLLALAWNYASPGKFCFMGVLLFYLYLYQSGYISLPAIFQSEQNEVASDAEPRQLSRLLICRNALVSFFTSLMPSNENNL